MREIDLNQPKTDVGLVEKMQQMSVMINEKY